MGVNLKSNIAQPVIKNIRYANIQNTTRQNYGCTYLKKTIPTKFGVSKLATNRPIVELKIPLSIDNKIFVKVKNDSIMSWDSSRMQVRYHSGRTDSKGGHRDLKNISLLGSYHYHDGRPAHTQEDKINFNLFEFIKKIKEEFDYYVSQVTDIKRIKSMLIGFLAGIIQNLSVEILDILTIIEIVRDALVSFLLVNNSLEIEDFFNNIESLIIDSTDNWVNSDYVAYKDSFYIGKCLADVTSIAVGLLGIKAGLLIIKTSFALGTTLSGTGAGALAAIVSSIEGALAGTAVATGSFAFAVKGADNFGKDFGEFTKNKGSITNEVADQLAKDKLGVFRDKIINGEIKKTTGGKIESKVATVVVDTDTGKTYEGLSGIKGNPTRSNINNFLEIHLKESKKILEEAGYKDGTLTNYSLDNCGEFNAINNALNDGANIKSLRAISIDIARGTIKKPCNNCKFLYGDLIKFIVE